MPNTREKLIELLDTVVSAKDLACDGEVIVSTARIADHLIANGVTIQGKASAPELIANRIIFHPSKAIWLHQMRFKVGSADWGVEMELPAELVAECMTLQKWIPVTERLPEDICPVLVALEGINIAVLGWYQDSKWWSAGAGSRPFTQEVTHWMPLPQPPKGE